jgi:hypothetical protein
MLGVTARLGAVASDPRASDPVLDPRSEPHAPRSGEPRRDRFGRSHGGVDPRAVEGDAGEVDRPRAERRLDARDRGAVLGPEDGERVRSS